MVATRFIAALVTSAGLVWAVASAAERLPGPYPAKIERVVDGDTLAVQVAIWLGQELSVLVRIRGIDAPELRGNCDSERVRAQTAASALEQIVSDGEAVLTEIEGDKFFGRVVADVATSDGADVADSLIAGHHARVYDGGARQSWCDVGDAGGEPAATGSVGGSAPD